MRNSLKIFAIIFLLNYISCKQEVDVNVINEDFCNDELEILIDNNRIIINKDSGFGTIERDSNSRIDRKSFNLTKDDTNKLFSYGFKLIILKKHTLQTESCYAGQNFVLRLNCTNKSLEFHHPSVSSWSSISNETKEIYSILNKKINLIK